MVIELKTRKKEKNDLYALTEDIFDYGGCPAIAFGTKKFTSFWIYCSICLSFSPVFEL